MLNFAQARTHMVDCQIHTSGVTDPLILSAFGTIPRELFIPEKLHGIAYHDHALDIGQGRFLLDPTIHAKMIQAVKPEPADIALDVGCGTGYSSMVLSSIVTTVIAVENNKRQIDKAAKLWDRLGACNIVTVEGELNVGAPANAPYSLIIVNGSVAEIPLKLCAQLAPRGRLICIVKPENQVMGRAVLVYKDDQGGISKKELFDAAAPYLSGFEPAPVFKF